jgi:hypothetical protein
MGAISTISRAHGRAAKTGVTDGPALRAGATSLSISLHVASDIRANTDIKSDDRKHQ